MARLEYSVSRILQLLCSFRAQGVEQIADSLAKHPALQRLDLGLNILYPEAARHVARTVFFVDCLFDCCLWYSLTHCAAVRCTGIITNGKALTELDLNVNKLRFVCLLLRPSGAF